MASGAGRLRHPPAEWRDSIDPQPRYLAVLLTEQRPEAVTQSVKATPHLAKLAEQPHGVLSLHRHRAGLEHSDGPSTVSPTGRTRNK